jgi:thiamine pyrophosphokinase
MQRAGPERPVAEGDGSGNSEPSVGEGGERCCVLVLAGGDLVLPGVRERLPHADFVIAADSGVHLAAPLGLQVDLVVGDFDSADPDVVAASGAAIEQHPTAKDETDLELALDAARRAGAHRIVVVGGGGGRLDHLIGNVLLLAAPAYENLHIEAAFGDAHIAVVHGGQEVMIDGAVGDLVTLLPVGGTAQGIVTSGLEYPLAGESLGSGTTRGVSNVMQSPPAIVAVDTGTLLVIRPGGSS